MSEAPGGARPRYDLVRLIATGGMGQVWQAEDTLLEREVAVKVLKAEYAGDDVFRRRFEAEARMAAGLQHPHVAAVLDYGEREDPDGGPPRPMLVMELVEGHALSQLIGGGDLSPEVVADLVAQAALGLHAAHERGIVHRDVKPGNVLVTPDGRVKVTDFGIARAADSASLTMTGHLVGTPHYLSPEQAEGVPASPRSDVYALGVVLYECLTGAKPFAGDSPVVVAMKHVSQPLPPLPDHLPERLRAVVDRACAKDPETRFADGAEMAAALRGEVAVWPEPGATTVLPVVEPATEPTTGPTARPTDPAPTTRHSGRSRRTTVVWLVAAVAVLGLLVPLAWVARGALGSDPVVDSPPVGLQVERRTPAGADPTGTVGDVATEVATEVTGSDRGPGPVGAGGDRPRAVEPPEADEQPKAARPGKGKDKDKGKRHDRKGER